MIISKNMGAAPGKALGTLLKCDPCKSLFVYVLNESRCRSECGDMCLCEFETEYVEPQSDSEVEVEIDGCCLARKS